MPGEFFEKSSPGSLQKLPFGYGQGIQAGPYCFFTGGLMKKVLQAAGCVLCSILFLVGLLCGVTLAVAGDTAHMNALFFRYADPAITGIDTAEYPAMAERITAYLLGKADTFQTTLSVHGQIREAFSEKELAHMQDVRNLFALCRTISQVCLAALFLMALAVFRFNDLRAPLARSYLFTSLGIVLLAGALAVWAAVDFHTLFTDFHHLFFTNDLWLLNPYQDLLLQLMPTGFFIDYAARIGLYWLLGAVLPALAAILYLKRRKCKA